MQQTWRTMFITLQEIKNFAKKCKINMRKINIKHIVEHVKDLVDDDIDNTSIEYLRHAFREHGLI